MRVFRVLLAVIAAIGVTVGVAYAQSAPQYPGATAIVPVCPQPTGSTLVGPIQAVAVVSAAAGYNSTQTQADQINTCWTGIRAVLDWGAYVGAGTIPSETVEIDGKDTYSGKYYALLTGSAVSTTSTVTYTVFPGATNSNNAIANDQLPNIFRIKVTHGAGGGGAVSYSVSYVLLP